MNKIDIKTKYGIVDMYWHNGRLKTEELFDSKEEAEKYAKEHYLDFEVKYCPIAVTEGDVSVGECQAYPVAVTEIKYKDVNGKIWDNQKDCEISNACSILNQMIKTTVYEYKLHDCRYYKISKKIGVYKFEITCQKQIDALWIVYHNQYDEYLKDRRKLLSYDRNEYGYCDEIDKQLNRPKWINKLNNIQKMFDEHGRVKCKLENSSGIEYYRGEEYGYFKENIFVDLGKKGVTYVRKNADDKSCETCKFRGTNCGYSCNSQEPRCYVEAEIEDVEARPEVYADSFNEVEVRDWSGLDTFKGE